MLQFDIRVTIHERFSGKHDTSDFDWDTRLSNKLLGLILDSITEDIYSVSSPENSNLSNFPTLTIREFEAVVSDVRLVK